MPGFYLRCGAIVLAACLAGCGSSSSPASTPSSTFPTAPPTTVPDTSPAVSVNGHAVPMTAYNMQVTILEAKSLNTSEGINPCDPTQAKTFQVFCHKLKEQALNTVIGEELIRQYATAHHIALSAADSRRQWSTILSNKFHSDNAVVRAYARSIGVTVSDLKTFSDEDLLQQRVMYQVTRNMPRTVTAVRLARILARDKKELSLIHALLKTHTFLQAAVTISEDPRSLCTHQACGDLGWLPYSFVPAAQHEVISDKDGSLAGPFAGQAGYALFLVEAHSSRYRLTSSQELAMRQQLFAQWLQTEENRASVHRYATT